MRFREPPVSGRAHPARVPVALNVEVILGGHAHGSRFDGGLTREAVGELAGRAIGQHGQRASERDAGRRLARAFAKRHGPPLERSAGAGIRMRAR